MAEDFLSPIDMLLDESNTENIKLYNEENQEVEFEQIALVPIENKTYAILKPVVAMEGIADDEALVFVIEEIDDEDCLVIVEEDAVVDQVFDEYYKMLKEEGVDVDATEATETADAE
jgi:predicted methyltransferase